MFIYLFFSLFIEKMKKIMRLRVYACLLFLGLMASCTTNDDFAAEYSNVKTVIIEAAKLKSSVDSRTSLKYNEELSSFDFSWRDGDTLGIFPNKGGYQVAFPLVGLSDDTPATSAEFDGGGWALVTDAQYSAYYPFGYNNRDFKSVPVSFVGQKQVGENANHIGAYDYMWASSELQDNGKLKFFFEHLGSLIYFKVDVPEGVSELELTSIEIVSSDDDTFVNKGYYNLNDETPSITATESSAKLSLDVSGVTLETGKTSILYVWTAPTDLQNKDITIKVYGKDQWYKMSKTISRKYESGISYYITVNALELGGNIVDEQVNGVYEINTLAELKWFANQVNSGTNDFNGKTVRLMNDIDLNNEVWTPIGQLTEDGGIGNTFKGTFDGNGFTIKNLSVTVEDGAAGLFGTVQNCIEIKNLKIENANIESNHYAGALVGFLQENGNYHGSTYYTVKVTDCEVNNVTVKVTPNQVNGSYDNGDKAGGLIGYAASDIDITNCKVNNANITGYRDLGGLVGHSNTSSYGNVTISNCDVRNTVITQDLTNGYKDPHPATLGAIYGRGSTDGVNNNHINVTIVCPSASAMVDGVMYANLAEAISAVPVSTKTIVTLLNDTELTETLTIPANKIIILDLMDHTLSYTSATVGEAMITNNGSLTIKDSGTAGKISFSYTGKADATYAKGNYTINNSGGNVVIENGTIEITASGCTGKFGHALYALQNGNGASLTISGGKILNPNNIAIRQFGKTSVTVNGGEIIGLRAIWMQAPGSNTADAPEMSLTVNGGTLTGTAIDGTADSGNILAVYSYSYGNSMKNINININGGTFNGDVALTGGRSGAKVDVENVTITGGTFNGLYGDIFSYAADNLAAAAIKIEGGTFSSLAPLLYMSTGENANIKLAKDLKLETDDEGIVVQTGVGVNLDLNGKTISQEKAQTTTYAMILNKGNLTIKDSSSEGTGKISYKDITEYSADNNYASNTIRNEGILTLKSGTVENVSDDNVMEYGYPHAIDVYQGSTTNIEGGTVKSSNYDCIRMFCNSTTLETKVNISGGKIINRLTFQNPTSNKAGYGVLNITGGTFTTTDNVNANVRLLNFSTEVGNMKATISGGTFDKGVKTQNYATGISVSLDDWLTTNGIVINEVK